MTIGVYEQSYNKRCLWILAHFFERVGLEKRETVYTVFGNDVDIDPEFFSQPSVRKCALLR